MRESNRQKVLKAMEELNYQPNSAARSLVRGKTGVIGMSINNFNDSFYDRVIRVVNRKLTEQGYFLALSIAENEDEGDNFLFQKDRVDGIILLSPLEEEASVEELKKKKTFRLYCWITSSSMRMFPVSWSIITRAVMRQPSI
ncbi:hypothetical protein ACFSQ7_43860 [Paenibacillus rhizoplanae]